MIVLFYLHFYLLMCWFVLTGFLFGLYQNGVSKKRIPLLAPKIIQPVVSVAFFVCFCLGLVKPPFHTDYRKQLSITAKTPWL